MALERHCPFLKRVSALAHGLDTKYHYTKLPELLKKIQIRGSARGQQSHTCICEEEKPRLGTRDGGPQYFDCLWRNRHDF
jgi:hypothetical protein